MDDLYADFVSHPRFRKRPNLTGLNPQQFEKGVSLHWHSAYGGRIPGTAIEADKSRQCPSPFAVSHYFDERRECVDCHRPFIFLAEEQMFWYEDLGFGLDADCVRCYPCRQKERMRLRYEELFHKPEKTAGELIEFAEMSLSFIERRVFTAKQIPSVRRVLNLLRPKSESGLEAKIDELTARVVTLEARG